MSNVSLDDAWAAVDEIVASYAGARWVTYVAVEVDPHTNFRVQMGVDPEEIDEPGFPVPTDHGSELFRYVGNVPVYVRRQERASALSGDAGKSAGNSARARAVIG